MAIPAERLAENLRSVRERIAAAAARAGRDAASVRLVAVTKSVGPQEVAALASLGLRDIGENRVQEALAKAPHCPGGLVWHMLGHLQTNKVKKALALFSLLHSVDSTRLLESLGRAAAGRAEALPILAEVNVSGEAAKFGMRPEALADFIRRAAELPQLALRGLMTMPPVAENQEVVRPIFRLLRRLLEEANARALYPRPLTELSMGMTQDFAAAVEEGATMVRIGTALFK